MDAVEWTVQVQDCNKSTLDVQTQASLLQVQVKAKLFRVFPSKLSRFASRWITFDGSRLCWRQFKPWDVGSATHHQPFRIPQVPTFIPTSTASTSADLARGWVSEFMNHTRSFQLQSFKDLQLLLKKSLIDNLHVAPPLSASGWMKMN